jgi:hypothetical protein
MPATTDIGCDPELLRALADASTYGATEPVEVHETHASWVFLAGDRAFKLKKPLMPAGTPDSLKSRAPGPWRPVPSRGGSWLGVGDGSARGSGR